MNAKSLNKFWRNALILSTIAILMLTGCMMPSVAQESHNNDMDRAVSMEKEMHDEKPHWSYMGEEGPAFWGDLNEEFAMCRTGVEQSPIDLTAAGDADLSDIDFNYATSALTVLNNGHTIQANYDAGSSIDLDGETFNLLQFHVHAMSEHTLDGEHFPLEIHLVHQSESGGLAVVGILVEEGEANTALSAFWENMPAEQSNAMAVAGTTLNAADFLPADQSSFRYMGSLTTPPCSEHVRWHILTASITMSAEQIAAFTDIFESNNRPVQPLNNRELVLDHASN